MTIKKKQELFIATDLVETAKEFQFALSFEPYDNRPQKAAEAIEIMGDPRELVGGKKVLIHAIGAYILFDSNSEDASIYHNTRLDNVILRSEFSRLAFVNHSKLSAFCLYLFNNKIVSAKEEYFNDVQVQSGVFVPVHEVESIWAA